LLWAIPTLWLAKFIQAQIAGAGGTRPVLAAIAAMTFVLVLTLPALPFIRCQLDFYAETSRFARAMASAAGSAPAGREVAFVNAPFFFSSSDARPEGCPSPYPWTPVGGVLIPPYAQAHDFVRFNGGPDRPGQGVTFAGYGPGWRTFGPEIDGETLRELAAHEAPFVFDLLTGSFDDLAAVWQPGSGESEATLVSFGDSLGLNEARMQDQGDSLLVDLDWSVTGSSTVPLAVFVHLYHSSGTLAAQNDAPPGQGIVPQALWQPGDRISEQVQLDVSALASGNYTVVTGVYDANSGVRLAAEAGGARLPDDAYLVDNLER
jgi:hypothetical protein